MRFVALGGRRSVVRSLPAAPVARWSVWTKRRLEVIGAVGAQPVRAIQLDVLVQRVVSPLDTGSIHGRGQGVLRSDRSVEVTFLLDQSDFMSLRERILTEQGEVRFQVAVNDVTAIDTVRERRTPV